MKIFQLVSSSGTYVQDTNIQPYRWDLYCAAFDVESMDAMFDLTPAVEAIPVLDAAITRFDTHAAELTALISPQDFLRRLRAHRSTFSQMRDFLAGQGGTITGAFPDPHNP